MSEKEVQQLIERMNVLIRLTAISVAKGRSSQEAIPLLSRAGLQPREIAALLGTTPNTVSVVLSRHRKTGRGREPTKENGNE